MKSKRNMSAADWDAYYATQPDESARRLIYRKLIPLVEGKPDSILDVGCAMGDGLLEFQSHFPGAELFGIDYSQEGIAIARRRLPHACFWVVDIADGWHALYFLSRVVRLPDLVLCVQTLEHFEQGCIPWIMAQLLETTGYQLVISVPYSQDIPDEDHKTIFYEDSFGTAMQPDKVRRDGCHMAFSWVRKELAQWKGYKCCGSGSLPTGS